MKDVKRLEVAQGTMRINPLTATVISAAMTFVFVALFFLPGGQVATIAKVGWAMATGFWVLNYYMMKLTVSLHNELLVATAILSDIQRQAKEIIKKGKADLNGTE